MKDVILNLPTFGFIVSTRTDSASASACSHRSGYRPSDDEQSAPH